MAQFQPGQKRPPGAGRKKGVKNRPATLGDRFTRAGVSVEEALVKAVQDGNAALVNALTPLLPYLNTSRQEK